MEGSAKKSLFESQAEEVSDEPEVEEEAWSDIPDEQDPHELADEILEYHRGGKRKPSVFAHVREERKREREAAVNGDLAEYFGDIEPSQQIAICRAYASYLAAQSRARKPGHPEKYLARRK